MEFVIKLKWDFFPFPWLRTRIVLLLDATVAISQKMSKFNAIFTDFAHFLNEFPTFRQFNNRIMYYAKCVLYEYVQMDVALTFPK